MTNAVQNTGVIPSPGTVAPGAMVGDPGQVLNPGGAVPGPIMQDPGQVTGPSNGNGPLSRGTPPSAFGIPPNNGGAPASASPMGSGAVPPPDGGGASGIAMSAYDDGGDVQDTGNGTPSIEDALQTIQQTLDYGRQKNGIVTQSASGGNPGEVEGEGDENTAPGGFAANWNKMRPSTNVNDMSEESAVGSSDLPVMKDQTYGDVIRRGSGQQGGGLQNVSFDDGGDVDNPTTGVIPSQPQQAQGQPQAQRGAPPSLVGYAMGSDAVMPDVAQALEKKVDPKGTLDGSTRKILAIAAAPDQHTQWGMMQHYRQKFNATSAFARAALRGNAQKPANLGAAAQAATQAYENVPDGSNIVFQPTKGGVVAHVHQLAGKGGQSQEQDQDEGDQEQGFDDGGTVDFQSGEGIPSYDDTQTANPGISKGADASEGTAKGDFTSPEPEPTGKVSSYPMSAQQLDQFLAGPGQYDAVMKSGGGQALADFIFSQGAPSSSQGTNAGYQPPAQRQQQNGSEELTDFNVLPEHPTPQQIADFNKRNISSRQAHAIENPEQSLYDEAGRLYSAASQTADRQEYIKGRLIAEGQAQAAEDLEHIKGKNLANMWNIRGTSGENIATIKGNSAENVATTRAQASRENNQNTVQGRLLQAIIQATGRQADVQTATAARLAASELNADPSLANDTPRLLNRMAPIAARYGMQPAGLARAALLTAQQLGLGQSQQPAPQQGATSPQTQVPEIRYDKQGKAWTLQNGQVIPYTPNQ